MTTTNKHRAGRNHTITLTAEERETLATHLCSAADLREGFRDDMVINADMMECIDDIPDAYFDLAIIDPPYNIDKTFNGTRFEAMTSGEYEEWLRGWFNKVCDKVKPDGSLYICGDWKCTASIQRVVEERMTVMNRISWQREKGRGAKHNWKNSMEDIWFAVKNPNNYHFDVNAVMMRRRVNAPYRVEGKPKDWEETGEGNFRMTHPSNFWDDISVPFWSMHENTDHPTQKPEKLYAKLILASSKPGDRILDPFLGSGTAAVVAKKLDRRFCGIEIDREYCLWTAKRLVNADKDRTIQGYADGVFWERNSQNEMNKLDKKRKRNAPKEEEKG
ncbi:MAG: DNA-methyltransferase [Prevotella sp.]